jgi:hypothetical protein
LPASNRQVRAGFEPGRAFTVQGVFDSWVVVGFAFIRVNPRPSAVKLFWSCQLVSVAVGIENLDVT